MHYKCKCEECESLYFSLDSVDEFDHSICTFCNGYVKFVAMSTEPFVEQTYKGKAKKYDNIMIMYGAAAMTGACKSSRKKKEKAMISKVKSKKSGGRRSSVPK